MAGIAYFHGINQQQYTNDTQQFFSLFPSNYMPDINMLTSYIHAVHIDIT